MSKWKFWIDRGGTFTDVVAISPTQKLHSHKLLSENPNQYQDATLAGIKKVLNLKQYDSIPTQEIDSVKIGTTVATNALLEYKGEPTVLIITAGFADALRIAYQNRPKIFELDIKLPKQIYDQVVEINERVTSGGKVLRRINEVEVREQLQQVFGAGFRSIAIVLMHAYRFSRHEKIIANIAAEIGFSQISSSHETIPLMKLISRGETTVMDAYLSPLLKRYIEFLQNELPNVPIFFMQSNGGLVAKKYFRGRDSILSGPAGGVVGMIKTAEKAGFNKIVGFDMGGTSTDVSHYAGEYERQYESEIAGIKLRSPMLMIHTIAAGGGSVLHFQHGRYVVGPDSAGANPGPACYRRDGPLTLTDCNVLLGKIQPQFFPKIFGENANQQIDSAIVKMKFLKLAESIQLQTGELKSIESIASGFLQVAIENMANAIKKISIARGYNVTEYLLNGFGGAAGQHVCQVADALSINKILLHSQAGVLSALGIGMAEFRHIEQQGVEAELTEVLFPNLAMIIKILKQKCQQHLQTQGVTAGDIYLYPRIHLRYLGTDTVLTVHYKDFKTIYADFQQSYLQQFGFIDKARSLVVDALSVEAVAATKELQSHDKTIRRKTTTKVISTIDLYTQNKWWKAKVYKRQDLLPNSRITGPALLVEANATSIVEPEWQGRIMTNGDLLLERRKPRKTKNHLAKTADPVLLEIFNNRFMNIAEQMGVVLKNTASSVNIKERLDFSCAIFNNAGELVANAPHIPVHLGSMSDSVKYVVNYHKQDIKPGDVFITNDPYHGGTHLPDVTMITPVFHITANKILFFVASRGHHADIGGLTPGSMPANSQSIHEEGVFIKSIKVVKCGRLLEDIILNFLKNNKYPARNPKQNLEDFKAQIAANNNGVRNLEQLCEEFSVDVVLAYMRHVRDNARACVKAVLAQLKSGHFTHKLDNDSLIQVNISIDHKTQTARFDFTGTSAQLTNNFNAPAAVTTASIIYVLRCLVDAEIPLNGGCLEPIEIIIPEASLLNPKYPAAVVAGNVETSQYLVDAILAALNVMAASQGTTNSFTFGNEKYQYYETICGGAGAGAGFHGASAVHTHITNTRLTDPEVLEWRFPVLLESFSIRPASGGQGKFNGGDGVIRRIRFLETMTASIISSHRKYPPFGLVGGMPGKAGKNWVERFNGTIEPLSGCDSVLMNENDVFVIATPGGGGYGNER